MLVSILQSIADVPPLLIATLIGLIYIYFAAQRWRLDMLMDAGLLALYLWRPSSAMLAFVLLLGAVRHVPAYAREVAIIFRLAEFDGWTVRAVLFCLPALSAYADDAAPRGHDLLQRVPLATGKTVVLPGSTPPSPPALAVVLSPRQWLERVNRTPTYPHTMIVGGTRLGKTTMAQACLADRDGDLVVCTPKSEREDPWAGMAAVRTTGTADDPDWTPIAHATASVYREMNARRYENAPADRPLTLVIDEVTEALDEIPALHQQLIRLWKTGASANVRVLVIDPEENVKAWGLENRGDIRRSMLCLRVADDRSWSIGRYGAPPQSIDARGLLALASAADFSSRAWSLPAPVPQIAPPSARQQTAEQTDGGRRVAPDELLEYLYTVKGLRNREAMREHLLKEYGFRLDNNRFTAMKKRLEGVAQTA